MSDFNRRFVLKSVGAMAAMNVAGVALEAGAARAADNGYIIFATGADAATLDPQFSTDLRTRRLAMQVHETLVTRAENGGFRGLLAENWEVGEDGVSWTFRLRQGVTFHDGTDFNAEAVRFSFERLLDPQTGSPRRSMGDMLAEVTPVDSHTVLLKTKEPYSALLAQLSLENLAIISPDSATDTGKGYGQNPAGTGPFKLESWQPGERIRLAANSDYWDGAPAIGGLEFRVVPEDSARILVLLSGEAHLIENVTPVMVERLQSSPNVQLISTMSQRTVYFGLNTSLAPFDNLKVRQAMAHAIDTRTIVQHVLNGLGETSRSFIDPAILGLPAAEPYEYNPEKSKQLLAEAGFEGGVSVDFYHTIGVYLNDRAMSEVIQAQAALAGFNLSLKTVDYATHLSMIRARDRVAAFLLSEGVATGDADVPLSLVMKSGGPSNYFNYASEAVDALIDKQRAQFEPTERLATVGEALDLISEDVPLIPLFYSPQLFGASTSIGGFVINRNEYVDFRKARFV